MNTGNNHEHVVLAATDMSAPQFFATIGGTESAQPYLEHAKHFGSVKEANEFAAELMGKAPHPDRCPPFVAYGINAAAELPGRLVLA